MLPRFGIATGGGGFTGSSSAASDTGAVGFGPFVFQPKGGTLPAGAWIAIAAAAVVVVVILVARSRR